MWVVDAGTLAYLMVNDAAVDLYGYTRAEFLAMTIRGIWAPEDVTRVLSARAHRPSSVVEWGVWRHRKKDGRIMEIDIRGRVLEVNGRQVELVMALDVSAERRDREQLEQLSRRLFNVQEADRRELARALHDEVGQLLTALQLLLEGAGGPGREGEMLQLVKELHGRVRATSLDLRPPMLDDLGLLPALLWHVDRYTKQTGVRVHFEHAGLSRRFSPQEETAGFRIVQEALTNVARHATVRAVGVKVASDPTHLIIEVSDRGSGFDVAAVVAAHYGGLAGMRERVHLLGGDVRITSVAHKGTQITARIPLMDVETTGQ
jgi:PAS domain S-box-containing protein